MQYNNKPRYTTPITPKWFFAMRDMLLFALATMSNGTFVRVASTTDVPMKKRNNPLANRKVVKVSVATLQYGCNYEKCVNHRTADGVEFKGKKLRWGKWVEGLENKVLIHNDELYVRLYQTPKSNLKEVYFVDGQRATADQVATIKTFAYQSYSDRQAEVGIEDYEDQVKPRSYKFTSINWLKCGQVVFNGMVEVVGA